MSKANLSPERLEELIYKVDRAFAGDTPIFTRQDADDLRQVMRFVDVFAGDPSELREMQDFWKAGKGFIKFGKYGFYFAAAITAFLINWDRLLDIFSGGRP